MRKTRPENHEHVVDALAEILELPAQTEHDTLTAILRRAGTPFREHETRDGAIRLVKVADSIVFVFDQSGKCGRVVTAV